MSDDDVTRDLRGRIVKGSIGLHRKQEPQDTQPDPPSGDFDDDLIAAANSYGQSRSKVGRRAWCENFRDTKPAEFAAQLRASLARKAEAQTTGSGGLVHVSFVTAPAGMRVDENGQLIEEANARERWARKSGVVITEDVPPPAKPVLVHPPRDPDEEEDEPPADNEIAFGGSDDEPEPEPPPPRDRGGLSMNELWRRNTRKPK